jgi:hypothetical protein
VFQAIDISNWSCKTFLESIDSIAIPKNNLIFKVERAVRSIVGRVFVENVSKRKKVAKKISFKFFC